MSTKTGTRTAPLPEGSHINKRVIRRSRKRFRFRLPIVVIASPRCQFESGTEIAQRRPWRCCFGVSWTWEAAPFNRLQSFVLAEAQRERAVSVPNSIPLKKKEPGC